MLKKDHRFTCLGGVKRRKSEAIFDFLGDLDEFNAALGLIRAFGQKSLAKRVLAFQEDLVKIGGAVGAQGGQDFLAPATARLETEIARREDKTVKEFSRPGASKTSAFLHLARALARRAERSAVGLKKIKHQQIVAYLNRLSLLLFWLAKKEEK